MPKAKTKTSVVKATVKTKSPRKVIKRSTVQTTKVEIDNIRGVDSGGHVRNLMEKELVEVCGKSSELGNPNFYGTTKKFLELYGLNTIEELPSIEDIKEMA